MSLSDFRGKFGTLTSVCEAPYSSSLILPSKDSDPHLYDTIYAVTIHLARHLKAHGHRHPEPSQGQRRTGKMTLDTILREIDATDSCLKNHSAHSVVSARLACIARRDGAAPSGAPPRPRSACACSASSATRDCAPSQH